MVSGSEDAQVGSFLGGGFGWLLGGSSQLHPGTPTFLHIFTIKKWWFGSEDVPLQLCGCLVSMFSFQGWPCKWFITMDWVAGPLPFMAMKIFFFMGVILTTYPPSPGMSPPSSSKNVAGAKKRGSGMLQSSGYEKYLYAFA